MAVGVQKAENAVVAAEQPEIRPGNLADLIQLYPKADFGSADQADGNGRQHWRFLAGGLSSEKPS
ncbi:hypothetical protein [Leisingera daeponensis]|uniref:hypothetical protein n=1 Tax=Leisingera daeponensis TaxID=405746 RepID=UPI0021BD21C7|nr:hypothetical protein [Leisingera daeponensis]